MFSSKNDSQTSSVANQQVGVQGDHAIGQSGTVGGSQAAAGAIALGITSGGVTITTTTHNTVNQIDAGSVEAGKAVATAAITSNLAATLSAERTAANALNANVNVAVASVNAAQQLGIDALHSLQIEQENSYKIAHDATLTAQNIALTATPQSAGAELQTLSTANQKNLMIVAAAIVGILIIQKSVK